MPRCWAAVDSLLSSKESSKEALPAANYFLLIKALLGAAPPNPQGAGPTGLCFIMLGQQAEMKRNVGPNIW